ncbi:MAG: ATP synthase F1 subunit gamma [Nannocystaceae bacterium]|nr:ATP synthase F1 subunit gamma [bacterium]
MANLKELRLRIGSVKNTRKITSAMSQIATARLRRAQNAALAARPYGERLQEVVAHLIGGIDPAERSSAHPLLEAREVAEGEEHTLYIAMTADKGLCGGFNGNINRSVLATLRTEREAGRKASLITIGAKGSGFFSRDEGLISKHAAPTLDTIVELSKAIAAEATGRFLGTAEGVDDDDRPNRVVLVYNHFVSVLTQEVTELQLCPLQPAEAEGGSSFQREPVFEPSRGEILEHLVPVTIESMLQQAMFNSVAAEIAARRVAMDAATDNASELIADLTLEYNRERQAAITSELMEIIGGAEALKG